MTTRMEINGLITSKEGRSTRIIGFVGNDLECEGCEAKVSELHETDDSVMLCEACFKSCLEEPAL